MVQQKSSIRTERNKYCVWNYSKEAYYPCRVCGGWYLLENYNFKTHKCKKCLLENKKLTKTKNYGKK